MTRRILYIGSSLPCRSETFVYREIFALRKRGCETFAASVHMPEKNLGDEQLDLLAEEAYRIYAKLKSRFLFDVLQEMITHPKDSIKTLLFCFSFAGSPFQKLTLSQRFKILFQAFAALGSAKWTREKKIEHIHAHMAHVPTSIAMFLGRHLHLPFSFTGHAADLFCEASLLKEKIARAAFVSCISLWHRRYYKSLSGVEWEKLPLIRCGIDIQAFHAGPKKEKQKRKLKITSIGRLVPKKGHEYLIKELDNFSSQNMDWECIIIGDGAEKQKLERMIDVSKSKSRIHLLGPKSNKEIISILKNSDIFVLPCIVDGRGDRDGIPVSILEAMAACLPVISGDIPTIREAIENNVDGILVDPKVIGALWKSLALLAGSPEIRKNLGLKAREKIAREFSIDCSIDQLLSYFSGSSLKEMRRFQLPLKIESQKNVSCSSNYVVISPCKDEAKYLAKTIESVLKQSVRPALWVIVDDGSCDETPRLLEEYAKRYDFIKVIKKEGKGIRNVGPGVVDAFYFGLDTVDLAEFEFLCKLDLDLELPEKYFEILIRKMEENPRIGTCSGKPFLKESASGKLIAEPSGDEISVGMTKFYRIACFLEIGGFVREVMWDGIDCHRCRMLGWIAESFNDPELQFIHLRPMGSSQQGILAGRIRHGKGQYFMGSHPLYILISSFYRMTAPPKIFGGMCIFSGYVKAWATGAPRYEDKSFREFLRRYQMHCLLFGKRRATAMTNERQALIWAEKQSGLSSKNLTKIMQTEDARCH